MTLGAEGARGWAPVDTGRAAGRERERGRSSSFRRGVVVWTPGLWRGCLAASATAPRLEGPLAPLGSGSAEVPASDAPDSSVVLWFVGSSAGPVVCVQAQGCCLSAALGLEVEGALHVLDAFAEGVS